MAAVINKNTRILWLDAAKGIGILLVILGHIIPMDQPVCHYIYSFHIPLFFILSGMLPRMREGASCASAQEPSVSGNESCICELRAFLAGKCRTLFYPYAVFSFLGLVVIRIYDGLERFGEHVPSATFLLGNGPLWFLPALFVAEVLFYIVNTVLCRNVSSTKRERVYKLLIFAAAFGTSCWFSTHFYGSVVDPDTVSIWSLWNVVNRGIIGFLWMEIGNALALAQEKLMLSGRRIPDGMKIALALAALCISMPLAAANSYVDLHYSLLGDPILYYLCGLLAGYSVIVLCQVLPDCGKTGLAFLGRNSLLIFATHMNLGLVPAVLSRIPLPDGWSRWLTAALIIIACEIAGILLVNRFMKELVSYREFQRRILDRPSSLYLVFVGGGTFFLAQYAKYLWTVPVSDSLPYHMRGILAGICFAGAISLPLLCGLRIRSREGMQESGWRMVLCILTGNAVWYVMLYKTEEIMFWFQPAYLVVDAVMAVGLTVVQGVWIHSRALRTAAR